MKDYFTKAYRSNIFVKIKNWIKSFHFRRKVRMSDLIEITRFQKFCEDNPIKADISYLERMHEVFE